MTDNYESPEFFEDEFADDDIITLSNANGQDIDFVEIAGIFHKGSFYNILQPVELLDGMGEDEALVFLVTEDASGNKKYEIELDDEIIDAVFASYNELYDKAQREAESENNE